MRTASSRRAARSFTIAVAGLAAATGFVWLSVHHSIYAPGARHFARLIDAIFGERPDNRAAAIVLRKIYSIGAFGVLGIFVALARPHGRHRVRDGAIAVALVSTVIELVQKASGSPESLRSNAFDVACGAVGGALGAALVLALRGNPRGRRRRSSRM